MRKPCGKGSATLASEVQLAGISLSPEVKEFSSACYKFTFNCLPKLWHFEEIALGATQEESKDTGHCGLLTLRLVSRECGAPAPGWNPKVRESKERQSSSVAWSDRRPAIQRYATTAPGLYRELPLCRAISRSQGFMLRLVLHTEADLVVVRHRRLRRGTAQLLGYKPSSFPLLHLGPVSVLFTAMQPAPNCQPLTPNSVPRNFINIPALPAVFLVCASPSSN